MNKRIIVIGILIVCFAALLQFFPFTDHAYKDKESTEQAAYLNVLYQCIDDYKNRNKDFPKSLHTLIEVYPDLSSFNNKYNNRIALWAYTPSPEVDVLIWIKNDYPHPDVVLTKNGTIKKLWKPHTFDTWHLWGQ